MPNRPIPIGGEDLRRVDRDHGRPRELPTTSDAPPSSGTSPTPRDECGSDRDLRTPAGLRGAPLAIAALDTAGINIDRFHHLALTRIDVHVFDDGAGIDEVRIVGSVLREARTQVFTEAKIEDQSDARRVVAFATADWAILAPTPEGFVYTDPGPGVPDTPDLPPLSEAYDAHPSAGGGFVIDGLSTRVGVDTLHHGPILVALEAAALEVATAQAETRCAPRRALHHPIREGRARRTVRGHCRGPLDARRHAGVSGRTA